MGKKKGGRITEASTKKNETAKDFGTLLSGLVADLMDEFDCRSAEELKAFMEGLAFGLQLGGAMNEPPEEKKQNAARKDIITLSFDSHEEALCFKWDVERELVKTHRLTMKQLLEFADISVFPPESNCMGWTNLEELDLSIKKLQVSVSQPRYIGYTNQYLSVTNKRRK